MTNTITKIKALARFLEEPIEDITKEKQDGCFSIGNKEYLVLTDEEADEKAKDYILESVWAFNADFIIEHSKVLDFDTASEQIVKAIGEQCESGNEAMLKLIDNEEEFIEDAISTDGRGHFMSTYDGKENEKDEYYIYRTN